MAQIVWPFREFDCLALVRTIDAVCADSLMATRRFELTSSWLHALENPACPSHLLMMVMQKERVLGWCRAFEGGNGAVNIGIGLLAECRSKGIGTSILRETLDWAQQRGFSHADLETRPENKRAICLFHNIGFMPSGIALDGQIKMRLDLLKERTR